MGADLFSKAPEYTIDTSSLIDIFADDKMVSKSYTPGLWGRILELIQQGVIISHIEVLLEIKKDGERGAELYDWAHANKGMFKDYDWEKEGRIIKLMSGKYAHFVASKINSVHADPWLIAQAKVQNLAVISEEQTSNSTNTMNHRIPNVCADSQFGVRCVNILGLMKEQGWKLT